MLLRTSLPKSCRRRRGRPCASPPGSALPLRAAKYSFFLSAMSTAMPRPAKISADLLGLAGAHQAVVDEDRLELRTEGPVGQDGAGGAVDAAGQGRDGLPEPTVFLILRSGFR